MTRSDPWVSPEKASDVPRKAPVLQDYGLTQKQYDDFISDTGDYDRALITVFAVSYCGAVALAVWAVIEEEWVLAFFPGVVALFMSLIIVMLIWGAFHKRQLVKSHVAFWVEMYKEDVAAYERWAREAENARQEAERAEIRKRHDYWMSLKDVELERELAQLYKRLGYQVSTTPVSGDDGVDLFLEKEGKTTVLQSKGYKGRVSPEIVRALYGSMVHFKADAAILVCTGGFTSSVRRFVRDKPINLVSADDLVRLAGGGLDL